LGFDVVNGGHVAHELVAHDGAYVPAGHSVQASEPFTDLYEPGGHGEHVESVGVNPGSQRHPAGLGVPAADDELAVHCVHALRRVAAGEEEYVFLGHAMHADVPETVLYVPAGHAVQFGARPVYPGLQEHWKMSREPKGDQLLALQLRHDDSLVARNAPEYLPAGQDLQLPAPSTSLYCPGVQAMQVVPSVEYPTVHRQSEIAVAPTMVVREKGGHGVHACGPVSGLKVLTGHMVHPGPV
jgi:hypothetical protein